MSRKPGRKLKNRGETDRKGKEMTKAERDK
jgi:hypothetical protein